MLAGFLAAMRKLAPEATFTAAIPFPLEPLRSRFPEIDWRPYDIAGRAECIEQCDAWLGLGGSPFQSAQSRWFVEHLLSDAETCRRSAKPMYFLGIGIQSESELTMPDVRGIISSARAIWTRDSASAARLARFAAQSTVFAGADIAHLFFRSSPPPAAKPGRFTVVANMDYSDWPGQQAFVAGAESVKPRERVWLAQETRDLPGAERALHAQLTPAVRSRWALVCPGHPGAPLDEVVSHWPSGEWLVTARYHAALAGAWSGSKVVVVETNEKLRAAAAELGCATLTSDADVDHVSQAVTNARQLAAPAASAERAFAACKSCIEMIRQGMKG